MKAGHLIRRSLESVLIIWLATFVVFILLHITPGDPAILILGENATWEQISDLRASMGLNLPLHEQYIRFLAGALRGDLGMSIQAQRPALQVVLERLPATIKLALIAFIISTLVGLPMGIVSAVKRLTWWDHVSMAVALLAQATPAFWLGLMLIVLFAVQLHWLPSSGMGTPRHIILPAVTLACFNIGLVIRFTRSGMLDALSQDYVRTARAKGLAEWVVLVRHALKNALIPVVTVLGLQMGNLLGGAVITETVFAWPGMGFITVAAIYQRDYPVVQAAVLVLVVLVVFINWSMDLVYSYLDPRIH